MHVVSKNLAISLALNISMGNTSKNTNKPP